MTKIYENNTQYCIVFIDINYFIPKFNLQKITNY